MPRRIIKDSICTSKNLNNLSSGAEVLFYRLIVTVDDFGRYDGSPDVILGRCFPKKLNLLTPMDIEKWLKELVDSNLIQIYQVEDMTYMEFVTWDRHQQIRAKYSKFPPPDSNCKQMITIDNNSARSRELRTNNSKNKIDKDDPDKYIKGKLGHMVVR